MSDNIYYSNDDVDEENMWLERTLRAAGVEEGVEFTCKAVGYGSEMLEYAVNHDRNGHWETHYFHDIKKAQAHLIESYPSADWENVGWL